MPFTELSLLVIDKANKYAGIPLLNKPNCSRIKYFWRGTTRKALMANGTAKTPAMPSRRQVSWIGLKAVSPRLIRMYDEPQISMRAPNKARFGRL